MSSPLRQPLRRTPPATQPPQLETERVRARVTLLIPEYRQAQLETADGRALAVTARTPGVRLDDLRVGQWLDCQVTLDQPHIVQARAVA